MSEPRKVITADTALDAYGSKTTRNTCAADTGHFDNPDTGYPDNAYNRHPDRTRCLGYLEEYGTPSHVIGHCKSVAAVAYVLADALNRAGGTAAPEFNRIRFKKIPRRGESGRMRYVQDDERTPVQQGKDTEKNVIREYSDRKRREPNPELKCRPLNLKLILAAGLLHDMARVQDRHWDVCADFCHEKGFYEEEQIVRIHMQYEFTNEPLCLTEADMVCLGDRLSLEDRYAGLDRRMDYIIKKAERNGNFDAREKILKKKEETRKLLAAIEERIGITIDELMKDIDYENTEGSCPYAQPTR